MANKSISGLKPDSELGVKTISRAVSSLLKRSSSGLLPGTSATPNYYLVRINTLVPD